MTQDHNGNFIDSAPIPIIRPNARNRVWMSGDEYTILVDAAISSGTMTSIAASVPPGGGPPVHVHLDFDELFVVLDGDVQIYADGSTYDLIPGEQFFVKRGTAHAFTNKSPRQAKMLLVYTPAGFENFFLSAGVPVREGESPPSSTPESLAREVEVAARFNTLPPSGGNSSSPSPSSGRGWDVTGGDHHDQ